MPYKLRKRDSRWELVKALTGEVVGHSDSKEKALAAMRARYANMPKKEKNMMIKHKKKGK